jgi:hypothetical protein
VIGADVDLRGSAPEVLPMFWPVGLLKRSHG